jgi:nucleoside-diphosphate kinase
MTLSGNQRTCVLVKPDGVCSHKIGKAIDGLESAGLKLVGLKLTRLERAQAESFYHEHEGKPFYRALVAFMTSAPIAAMAWEGPLAIQAARDLMGATDPAKARTGTLRRDYGTDNRYNFLHGSDSPASAAREIKFFFKPEELMIYGDNDWQTAKDSLKTISSEP